MNFKNFTLSLASMAIAMVACQQAPSNSKATDPQPPSLGSNDTLSVKAAQQYVLNYIPNPVGGTFASPADEDLSEDGRKKKNKNTRCVWFKLSRLEALVAKIKAEGGDGVRFYLAAYNKNYVPDTLGVHIPDSVYWGHNTLLMVSTFDSTMSDGKHLHWDYYTNDKPELSKLRQGGIIISAVIENRGEMCPPPANCNDIGATLITAAQ
ncbi:hypothetical protein [Chitinophaga vietnamensis]|uniref:hypothetical protein n=1 Tax=Chitinophaga vietnamensis TaxID=2593957 RepID=UPI0011787E91|nr:hypothetical protein [Chitinophaga vietnamensis]